MGSQSYRISNDKFWKVIPQRIPNPYKFYRKGAKYQDRLLPSGFYEGQTWGASHKCWIGFIIAKEKWEWSK
jgi:hypothetical protein